MPTAHCPVFRSPHHAPPLPARNDACWCGSGREYENCHRHTDELSHLLDARYGSLSSALIDVIGPVLDGLDVPEQHLPSIAWIAGAAWSISRRPEHTWRRAIRQTLRQVEGLPRGLAKLFRHLCERAHALHPDDPRVVARVWVGQRGKPRALYAVGRLE